MCRQFVGVAVGEMQAHNIGRVEKDASDTRPESASDEIVVILLEPRFVQTWLCEF